MIQMTKLTNMEQKLTNIVLKGLIIMGDDGATVTNPFDVFFYLKSEKFDIITKFISTERGLKQISFKDMYLNKLVFKQEYNNFSVFNVWVIYDDLQTGIVEQKVEIKRLK